MEPTEPHKISKAFESIDGIQRAEASPFLYGKIITRIRENIPAPVYYTGSVLIRFAMAMLLVAALNAATVGILKRPAANDDAQLRQLAKEYFGNEISGYTY
ncbi:MAG: hypothetical protein V4658_03840 [Bacteroidota bacterium]